MWKNYEGGCDGDDVVVMVCGSGYVCGSGGDGVVVMVICVET